MKLIGNLSANWEILQGEYEDHALTAGLGEKSKEVQVATLRSSMGAECQPVRKYSWNLRDVEKMRVTVILNSLEC